jgi:hypothetical protein
VLHDEHQTLARGDSVEALQDLLNYHIVERRAVRPGGGILIPPSISLPPAALPASASQKKSSPIRRNSRETCIPLNRSMARYVQETSCTRSSVS